ncbi:MAG TPA: carboxymuconolactone decarboxylase family protein [Pirellulales bacterium]|nr:carboxymuconolactone decarboxylase family protein [Pirellulales bacterium]
MTTRANYAELNRPAIEALGAVGRNFGSIEPKLRALVELRVSQINGCGYCVDVHATQARSHGETQQRLDLVATWWECDFFTPAEVAALGWAEALTDISEGHAPDELYQALAPHYSEQQIVDLTLIVSVMNAWNRIAIAFKQHPKRRGQPS